MRRSLGHEKPRCTHGDDRQHGGDHHDLGDAPPDACSRLRDAQLHAVTGPGFARWLIVMGHGSPQGRRILDAYLLAQPQCVKGGLCSSFPPGQSFAAKTIWPSRVPLSRSRRRTKLWRRATALTNLARFPSSPQNQIAAHDDQVRRQSDRTVGAAPVTQLAKLGTRSAQQVLPVLHTSARTADEGR